MTIELSTFTSVITILTGICGPIGFALGLFKYLRDQRYEAMKASNELLDSQKADLQKRVDHLTSEAAENAKRISLLIAEIENIKGKPQCPACGSVAISKTHNRANGWLTFKCEDCNYTFDLHESELKEIRHAKRRN